MEDATPERHGKGKVVALASTALLLFALSPITTRVAALALDPLMAGLLRTVAAVVVTLPAVVLLRLPLPRDAREWRLLLIATAGTGIVFPVLFCLGGGLTSASHAALILALAPLVAGLGAHLVDRRAPRAGWWLGAGIALAGEAALVLLRGANAGGAGIGGDLLIAAACLGNGIGFVAGARLVARIGGWAVICWMVNFASLVLAPVVLWRWSRVDWAAVGPFGWLALFHLTYGVTVVATIAWFSAMARGGIARVALLQFAQPVLSLGLAALLLGEPITLPLLVAAGGIFLGIAVARRG